MKLEKDHVLGIQSPPRKSYNPFDSDDEIEATNGHVKSSLNGYDIKSFETNADSLTFHLDNGDVSWEEAILNHSQILKSRTNPTDSSSEEVLSRKDTELFTEKTVTVDLPELTVCYKENTCHSVKDIGIDEGMPMPMHMHDKASIKSEAKRGDEHLKPSFMEGLKSRSDNNLESDISSAKRSQDTLKKDSEQDSECMIDERSTDDIQLNSSNVQSSFSMESTVDLVEKGKEVSSLSDPQETDDSKMDINEEGLTEEHGDHEHALSEEKTRELSTMMSVTDTDAPSVESNNENVSEETRHSLSSDSGVTNVLSYNSKVESGSIVLDFNSTTLKEKQKEDEEEEGEEEEEKISQIVTIDKPPAAQLMSRIDEEPNTTENRETSISAVMAPPAAAAITYMGPFGHNGSISLRSESSAGSTRSFAFPVLQAEWNSSPVRMAKAEHKNRKQRGWVHSVMCCRF